MKRYNIKLIFKSPYSDEDALNFRVEAPTEKDVNQKIKEVYEDFWSKYPGLTDEEKSERIIKINKQRIY